MFRPPTPMEMTPTYFLMYDNYEELSRLDKEYGAIWAKRSANLMFQLCLTIFILIAQFTHVAINARLGIEAGNWMYGYLIAILVASAFFIWRGNSLGKQSKAKLDEFFEELRRGNFSTKNLPFPSTGPG